MLSAQRRKEIENQIFEEPCIIEFEELNTEERSFAIKTVISARMKKKFSVGHFTLEQEKFLRIGKEKLEKWI